MSTNHEYRLYTKSVVTITYQGTCLVHNTLFSHGQYLLDYGLYSDRRLAFGSLSHTAEDHMLF